METERSLVDAIPGLPGTMLSDGQTRARPWPTRVAAGSAVFIVALGATVLVGWLSHTTWLIQFKPHLPPMTRNAAACFVLCGLALLMIVRGGPRWLVVVCAGIVGALSVLTLVEIGFGVNVGINELLGPSYVALKVSSPGRMAPVAAICFALGSLGLLLAPRILSKRSALLLGLNGSIIAAAGIATSMSFALGSSDAFGWRDVNGLALHTAVGLWVLGVGMLALAWQVAPDPALAPRWLPVSVAIVVATTTLGVWQALIADGYEPFALLPAVVLAGGCLMAPTMGLTVYMTQQALAQASALRQSEARKAAILDSALDCIVTIDHEGRIIEFNPAAERAFGYRRDEVMGKQLAGIIIPPSLREEHQKGLARYLATGEGRVFGRRLEMTALRADGSEFPVELAITRIPLKGPPSFTGYLRDITERKQAEKELRRSEAFLAEAQRLSATGSFSWRVATDEVAWSEEAYRIFELGPEVAMKPELIRTRVHPEDVALFDEMIGRARSTGSDFDFQHRLQMPDHSVKYLRVVAHATRNQDGELEYIGAIQDVTKRRQAEIALDEVRSELMRVARVTSLGVLTASIAHEVNQPLSGIVTNASTCLRMLAADPPNVDGARETARRTIRDGNRASDVITRLRALFGKRDATTEPVDLNEATREVIALSLGELQRSRVILRPDLADGLPPVTGDRVQLQQVILNLLRNASEAMSGVNDRPRHLVIRTERDEGDRLRLSVQDAGVGLEPKVAERLFEAFYTSKSGGMGIGLSVSRSIIESHQGRLWAVPNDGPGATFAFSIPLGREGGSRGPGLDAMRRTVATNAQHVTRDQ
jgi:PAS domain S-box-containing protein